MMLAGFLGLQYEFRWNVLWESPYGYWLLQGLKNTIILSLLAWVIALVLGMALGLLGRELAAADELGDERVVIGQLLERTVPEEVRAGVAHVADPDVVVLGERDRHRRPHSRG